MKKIRIISRLDVKGPNVIKGVQLECLRVMGKPRTLAKKYYIDGADEILYMDIVASLYQRNNLTEIVNEASQEIFVPLAVGGGARNIKDIENILRSGADKVAINTAAIAKPELITNAAKKYGSQCILVSIEAKKYSDGLWFAFTDNGRNDTGLDVFEWAKKAVDLGAGEILLTSVDREGTTKGFDIELTKKITEIVPVPVIASGGAGNISHIEECIKECNVDGVAIAHLIHYNKTTITDIKKYLIKRNIPIRSFYE